jgi:hypothetical protein
MEVGGCLCTHIFFKTIGLLELRTLIFTDLDAVWCTKTAENLVLFQREQVRVTLVSYIGLVIQDAKPSDFLKKNREEKTKGIRCLAYQVPEEEGKPSGRVLKMRLS